MTDAVVLTVGGHGAPLAEKLAASLGLRLMIVPHQLPQAITAFRHGTAIIGVMAAGILVRHFAPSLHKKGDDAPLILVHPHGAYVLPLTNSHHGASRWVHAVISVLKESSVLPATAAQTLWGHALSETPDGWHWQPHSRYASLTARVAQGEAVRWHHDLAWLHHLPYKANASIRLIASWRTPKEHPRHMVYVPKRLAVGVGCVRHASSQAMIDALHQLLQRHRLHPFAIAGFFSLDIKMDEKAIHDVAHHHRRAARFFGKDELAAQHHRLRNPSARVFREVGVYGVAESASLAAVGTQGRLIIPKTTMGDVTLAVSLARHPITHLAGHPRGRLTIIGIGGGTDSMTRRAHNALCQADAIVGFSAYLSLLDEFQNTAEFFPYAIGKEEERVHKAFTLANQGRDVALVSSGDAGIYGMASPAIECLQHGEASWQRIELTIIPGVSAMQEASSRHGAALGHDTALISLSDLLTERRVIRERLTHALIAQFVIALYNPTSSKRQAFFTECLKLIGEHRAPETPIIIARHLNRPQEHSIVTQLKKLNSDTIDMNTILIIGNHNSHLVARAHHSPLMVTLRRDGKSS